MRKKLPIFTYIVFLVSIFIFLIGWHLWLRDVWRRRISRKTFYSFVEKGETLRSIAEKHSVTPEKIAMLNKLPNPDKLYVGQPLLIPLDDNVDLSSVDMFREYCNFPEGVVENDWKYIIIHHSAFESGNASAFHEFHLNERGWQYGLGYQFVIGNGRESIDGGIEVGHRWARQMRGSHAKASNMNAVGIGICLVGNFEKTHPTEKQMETLTKLVRFLRRRYGIPRENILGHGEIPGASTLCPGKRLDMHSLRGSI